MSRSRMIGAVTALLASGALVAGCGGSNDGFTAAESAPTPSGTAPAPTDGAAAPVAPAAPAEDPSTKALGAYVEANPSKPTFRSYDGFSRTRAGKIFVSPVPPKVEAAPAAPATDGISGDTPTIGVPVPPPATGGTGSGGTGTGSVGSVPVPSPVSTGFSASIDVNGTPQTVKVSDLVANQFTVQAITADTVTLKLNSGTLPGGTDTFAVKVGESNKVTNPTAGDFTIAVKSITPEF